MSESRKAIVLDRIRTATPNSRIAVFKTGTEGKFNAVFESTKETLEQIKCYPDTYIGSYCGADGIEQFIEDIKAAS